MMMVMAPMVKPTTRRRRASIPDAPERSAFLADVLGTAVRHKEKTRVTRHGDACRRAPEDGLVDVRVVDGLPARCQGALNRLTIVCVYA